MYHLAKKKCSQGCHGSKHLGMGGVWRGHEVGLSAGLKEVLADHQRVPEREARSTTNLDWRCSRAKSEDYGEDLFIFLAEVIGHEIVDQLFFPIL